MRQSNLSRTLLAAAAAAALLAACGDGGGGSTPATPGPAVKIVSTLPALDEGYDASHTVTLEAATTEPASYDFSVGGTASAADIGPMTFSDGVTHDAAAKKLNVPAGVKSFTIHYTATFDTVADAGETVELTVGGVSGKATLRDPADKYVGEWDNSVGGSDCQKATHPKHPTAHSGRIVVVFSKTGPNLTTGVTQIRLFTTNDCTGPVLAEEPGLGIAAEVLSPVDVDGQRADRIVDQGSKTKSLANIRLKGFLLSLYPGDPSKGVDADGFPLHLDTDASLTRSIKP